ncbi:MAG TPA: glycosyltransferase [Polyangiaceae bacterium]|jgi:glycosyltransferase involved in cell wall biosynthesis|nr:glycosyltransferase [Polyangiaceae bacterium]
MTPDTDIVCLSHFRWGFVFQRPNHLMTRFARERRTFFFEEPIFDVSEPQLEMKRVSDNLIVVTPHLPEADHAKTIQRQKQVLDRLMQDFAVKDPVLWFYTPMALQFAPHIRPLLTIYDCVDELSAPEVVRHEKELLSRADLVFMGGHSLWEAKKKDHPRVYPFPPSVDADHFRIARATAEDPDDQASIPHPRIGFSGVIDERMDLDLVSKIASERPDWHLVMLGPVKIDPKSLPKRDNIHWLGGKKYDELPHYLAGWDVAMMPFALNPSTKLISPTRTLEYLAAGKPVVSTAIRDVVRPYGERGLVRIADAGTFVDEIADALAEDGDLRRQAADAHIARTSWDHTFRNMSALMHETVRTKKGMTSCSIT